MNVFVLMSVECKYIEQIRFWVVSQFIIMLEFPTFYFFPQFYYLTIVSSLLLPHLQVKMLHKEKKNPQTTDLFHFNFCYIQTYRPQ